MNISSQLAIFSNWLPVLLLLPLAYCAAKLVDDLKARRTGSVAFGAAATMLLAFADVFFWMMAFASI
jgi:hypothetical protein